jgi:hypothetical protein
VGLLAGLICQFIVRPFLVKWVDRKAGQENGRDEIAGFYLIKKYF